MLQSWMLKVALRPSCMLAPVMQSFRSICHAPEHHWQTRSGRRALRRRPATSPAAKRVAQRRAISSKARAAGATYVQVDGGGRKAVAHGVVQQ